MPTATRIFTAAALLFSLVFVRSSIPQAETPDLGALLKIYRSGDADTAVRTLASWPAARIGGADPHLQPGDRWGQLALSLLMIEANDVAFYAGAAPRPLNELVLRGNDLTEHACLRDQTDQRLRITCREALRLLVLRSYMGEAESIANRIEDTLGPDPLVRLIVGCQYEDGMLEVEGKGGVSKTVTDPGTAHFLSRVTSHGRVGTVQAAGG